MRDPACVAQIWEMFLGGLKFGGTMWLVGVAFGALLGYSFARGWPANRGNYNA